HAGSRKAAQDGSQSVRIDSEALRRWRGTTLDGLRGDDYMVASAGRPEMPEGRHRSLRAFGQPAQTGGPGRDGGPRPRPYRADSEFSVRSRPLTVAAVAARLGVAASTLRTWDRRYGLGPSA